MKTAVTSLFLIFSCLILVSQASRPKQYPDPVTGTWTGASICQVKDSPCKDEVAAYHATKLPGKSIYRFQMNKVVEGKEEEMGALDFTYDDKAKTLIAENNSARGKGTWNFKISGKTMHGTLTVGNTLYRVIDLKKAD